MRLIDADALMENISEVEIDGNDVLSVIQGLAKIGKIIDDAPTVEPKTKVIAQITFDEDKMCEIVHEAVKHIKEEYDIIDNTYVVSEWIPCSERLPETIGEYLITALSNPHKNRIVSAGYYHSRFKEFGTFKVDGSWEKWDVIAWMSLPKPYEGKKE